jgi:hypothetical protein
MKTTVLISAVMFSVVALIPISAESSDLQCQRCGQAFVVSGDTEKHDAIQHLQESFLRRIGEGQIRECSLVIGEHFGEGFLAVGGSCDVVIAGKKARWMICNDNGVGNFAAVTGARWWRDPKLFLTQFIESNCVGG